MQPGLGGLPPTPLVFQYMLCHALLSNLAAGMVVGHSTDFAGIDMSLHGAPIFLGHHWDWDCRCGCVANYKARPANNCLAFSDTIRIYINGTQ